MERSLNNAQPVPPSKAIHERADPFLVGFCLLYGGALIVSCLASGEWLATAFLGLGALAAVLVVLFLSRNYLPPSPDITQPHRECWTAVGWYLGFLLLSMLSQGTGLLANEFGKWLWFVILPLSLLLVVRGQKPDVGAILRSVGFRREGLGKAALLGFLAYLIATLFEIWFFPAPQLQKLSGLFQKPLSLLIALPIGFVLALITAGFTEEVFFRGILQARLANVTGSEIRSCLLTAFLFGIYHLPYAYFSPDWPTHGNIAWALSSVLTEQMVAGVVLGVLWLRTRNLAAPILFHSLVNTLPVLAAILKFG